MIEPILDLDEALESELAREREMVITYEQPELGEIRQLGFPIKLSRTPASVERPAPALGEHTEEVLTEAGLLPRGGPGSRGVRGRQGTGCGRQAGAVPGMSAANAKTENEEMLRMGELARASGVSAATIKHYLREGLLPEPMKTSRNMAYYPADFVERIRMIKQLQEERYMPLRVIKDLLEEDPDRARALIELGDRLLEHALAGESERVSAAEVRRRYDVPKDVLDRLAELEVLTPDRRGYSPSDVRIIEAISRFRAGGYEERIGFTVYDTLRYKESMADLVKQEVDVLMERLAGEMDPDEAMRLIEAGTQPLNDLLAAMHTKALVAELERRRGSGDGATGSGSD